MSSREVEGLRERAADILRERVITFQYRPGELLNVENISRDIGIGRTPVSQAIDRLALDGLVEIIPRTGVMVTPLTRANAVNIAELILHIEPKCARLAVERGTDEQISKVVALAEEADRLPSQEVETLVFHDREFHQAIASAARNPVMSETLRRLYDQFLRFCLLSPIEEEQTDRMRKAHAEIGDAFAARDPERAEAAVARHVETMRDR